MNKIKKTEKQIEKKQRTKKKTDTRVLKGLFFFLFALHFFFFIGRRYLDKNIFVTMDNFL